MLTDRPTLHLSNWSSHRTPGMHGPGRKFTIMARPRAWERGDGSVTGLVPQGELPDLMAAAIQERRDTPDEWPAPSRPMVAAYRAGYLRQMLDLGAGGGFGHGLLGYRMNDSGGMGYVADGDTLCCACSVAEARAGRCHRTWAAPFLVRAGWRVILDGKEMS